MNYFKQFEEWNNKYPEHSVKAEQYTYMTELLKQADAEIKANLQRANLNGQDGYSHQILFKEWMSIKTKYDELKIVAWVLFGAIVILTGMHAVIITALL